MAPVDSLLKLLLDNAADELRLGSDEAPRMYARGAQKRLALPVTADSMLRHLLGSLLSEERQELLQKGRSAEFEYAPSDGRARYSVTLRVRGEGATTTQTLGGLEAVFRVAAARPGASAAAAGTATMRSGSDDIGVAPRPGAGGSNAPAADALAAQPALGTAPTPSIAQPRRERVREEGEPLRAAPATAEIAARGSSGAISIGAGSILGALLSEARSRGASDVHLLDGAVPAARIDGALRPISTVPLESLGAILEALPAANVRAAIAGDRAYDGTLDFEDRRVRFHVYRAAEGGAAAMRLLPGSAPALSELNLPLPLGDLAMVQSGLVIVCGPTGSGKSATLAAIAQEAVRRRSALLITLEDPIEYRVLPGDKGLVRQRQVGRDVRDFPAGLRDALREDPDVILVGEVRDQESVALALTAAETGHLVLTSLHSRSAASAIERIVDACPGRRESEVRAQLAQALRAVVSQRLIPRARGTGRVPAIEVLRVNHNVAGLIREGKTPQIATALQSSRKEGMMPLETCLADLVRAGTISRDDAFAVANDGTALAGYLEVRG